MPRADIDARDRNILSHILAYCNDIAITHSERFCAAARELVFLKRLD